MKKAIIAATILTLTIFNIIASNAQAAEKTIELHTVTQKYEYAIIIFEASHQGLVNCYAYDENDKVIGTGFVYVKNQINEAVFPIYGKAVKGGCAYDGDL